LLETNKAEPREQLQGVRNVGLRAAGRRSPRATDRISSRNSLKGSRVIVVLDAPVNVFGLKKITATPSRSSWLWLSAGQMLDPVHALMQDSGDTDDGPFGSINDDVRSDQVELVGPRQVIAEMADPRILLQQLQCLVEFVAIDEKLLSPPHLACVAQDVDHIPLGFR
jgi:hypothetical protein